MSVAKKEQENLLVKFQKLGNESGQFTKVSLDNTGAMKYSTASIRGAHNYFTEGLKAYNPNFIYLTSARICGEGQVVKQFLQQWAPPGDVDQLMAGYLSGANYMTNQQSGAYMIDRTGNYVKTGMTYFQLYESELARNKERLQTETAETMTLKQLIEQSEKYAVALGIRFNAGVSREAKAASPSAAPKAKGKGSRSPAKSVDDKFAQKVQEVAAEGKSLNISKYLADGTGSKKTAGAKAGVYLKGFAGFEHLYWIPEAGGKIPAGAMLALQTLGINPARAPSPVQAVRVMTPVQSARVMTPLSPSKLAAARIATPLFSTPTGFSGLPRQEETPLRGKLSPKVTPRRFIQG